MNGFIKETVNSFVGGLSHEDGSYREGLEQASKKILELANTSEKIKKMWKRFIGMNLLKAFNRSVP